MSAWTEPLYVVRRVDDSEFTVAKFTGRCEPEQVYRVGRHASQWWTDSPAYGRMGEQEKHIRLAKHWVREGEPVGTFWRIEGQDLLPTRFLDPS